MNHQKGAHPRSVCLSSFCYQAVLLSWSGLLTCLEHFRCSLPEVALIHPSGLRACCRISLFIVMPLPSVNRSPPQCAEVLFAPTFRRTSGYDNDMARFRQQQCRRCDTISNIDKAYSRYEIRSSTIETALLVPAL